jgi:hypothetical protein
MKELEILKETVSKEKPTTTKKRNYKPRKKKEPKFNLENEMVMRSEEVPNIKGLPKQAGSYKIGKSFHIFFEQKPKSIHRFFTKLFLGWEWKDQK